MTSRREGLQRAVWSTRSGQARERRAADPVWRLRLCEAGREESAAEASAASGASLFVFQSIGDGHDCGSACCASGRSRSQDCGRRKDRASRVWHSAVPTASREGGCTSCACRCPPAALPPLEAWWALAAVVLGCGSLALAAGPCSSSRRGLAFDARGGGASNDVELPALRTEMPARVRHTTTRPSAHGR